jgi:hypothetical protein
VTETCFDVIPVGRFDRGAGFRCTGSTSTFTSSALRPGKYTMFAYAPGSYGHQWVGPTGGTGDRRAAATLTVRPGKVATAPDVRLDRAGTITGTVTDADREPVENLQVGYIAWDLDVSGWEYYATDEQGRYAVDRLGPYAWPLVFTKAGQPRQWSGGVANRNQAQTIPVTAGGRTTYDMRLRRGSTLAGTITVAAGGMTSWRLIAVNVATGEEVGEAYGEIADRDYELLVAGGQTVKIRWQLSDGSSTRSGWYDDAVTPAAATPVRVPRTGSVALDLTIGR